jgi:tight adherence protein B
MGFMFLICLLFFRTAMEDRIRIAKKLNELTGTVKEEKTVEKKVQKKKKSTAVSRVFQQELSSTGIKMRPEEFLILWILAAMGPSGLMLLLGSHPVAIIAAAAIGLFLPPVYANSKKAKRLVQFEKQLGDALVLMGNSLKAGMTFQQAMANIGEEMADPIGKEFTLTIREIKMGVGIDTALDNMVARVKSTDLMMTVAAVEIQRQVGGNMMEILENISDTIKDRLKLKNDIRVMTATGRTSGLVIGLLPVFISLILMLINPPYIMTFFETQLGIFLLIIAAALETIGFLLVNKMVTVKY